ncbi:Trehalose import ATP-binding protein SugC [Bordetella sputigena]|uniref:ABC transporter ATP-binding protein n=1 Tax=Bordetella sputigena TaxID=1416810 RepID=UPI0039F02703
MAAIELDLSHSYVPHPARDEDYALLPLQYTFRDGGAYALLGPSGCGKTTLLNCISGLLRPSAGTIRFDGRDVTGQTPQQRNIAQVFQFPVVYDTMTVAENLAFPLRNRGVPEDRVRERVGRIAEMLELSAVLDRRASGLAADAKQKISLGRGLVRSDVSAVLFDEPLTVIDPHLKWALRRKLKEIHQEFKLTLVYVTHDQTEALTFADQVVVMSRGKVMQVGSADDLFLRPAHAFVGHFIGSPGMNFLPARREGEGVRVGTRSLGQAPAELAGMLPATGAFTLGIRPEFTGLCAPDTPGALPVSVTRVQDIGTYLLLTGTFEGHTLRARLPLEGGLDIAAAGSAAGKDGFDPGRSGMGAADPPAAGSVAWLSVLNPYSRGYREEEATR